METQTVSPSVGRRAERREELRKHGGIDAVSVAMHLDVVARVLGHHPHLHPASGGVTSTDS